MISITQDDDGEMYTDASPRPSIGECHTDVEDLDSDQEKNNFISVLKRNSKCVGAVTDVEDYEDSGDNEDEPEVNYGAEVSLNDMLDQGCVDESSNLKGNQAGKLIAMHSTAKSPSPTAFHLTIACDDGGVTDVEDMEASSDDDDGDNEKVYSDDDKPIVLDDSNATDIHDSVRNWQKLKKHLPRVLEQAASSSSESEGEKENKRLKPYLKHFTKRGPKCSDAKSDVENIKFSGDEKKSSRQKPLLVLETPDVEVMAFDGSDHDDVTEPQFPEINISFIGDDKPKKKTKIRGTPAPSPMLGLPENQDEGHTDVENLNSSDDDEECVEENPKCTIPLAVIKSEALTDVENFDSESEEDCEPEEPDVPLPTPVREMIILVESKNGEPVKSTSPLPDNLLLGFDDLDADKGLTDVEDFSDPSDGDEDEEQEYEIKYFPDMEDGGVVESSDHSLSKRNSLATGVTPEPITDSENIFVNRLEKGSECRRRRTKSKHSQPSQHKPKSTFLDTKFYVDLEAGAHTDVEDLDVEDDDALLKDKSYNRQRRAAPHCSPRTVSTSNADGKTDVEYISDDGNIDFLRFTPDITPDLNDYQLDSITVMAFRDSSGSQRNSVFELRLPEIRRVSATPEPRLVNTDTDDEDVQCNSENDDASALNIEPYSRAQTATPMELSRDLADLCGSEIHEIHSGAFDRVKEHFEIKENLCLVDAHTDVENFDDDGQQ